MAFQQSATKSTMVSPNYKNLKQTRFCIDTQQPSKSREIFLLTIDNQVRSMLISLKSIVNKLSDGTQVGWIFGVVTDP
uniref:Uncharacterized protein n=1 Tax=Nelumbo nucifera TaxID=4432 RepID=A0A822YA29_NELNU|nr:TPA_asm: hypothetical protein HUJ06_029313 [Nelumbo nucifera]